MMDIGKPVVIIGAGPAGLTAAYMLYKQNVPAVVLEQDPVVGGISRTVNYRGYRADIGGHRFFTKVKEVDDLWHEILSSEGEFLIRPRKSRIFYDGKYFDYPLVLPQALRTLGFKEAALCSISLAKSKIKALFVGKADGNYEDWMVARFGWRLYKTFFKSYTEKVWGVPADEIPSDWAAQRVKDLSITKAVFNWLFPKKNQVTSLIGEFKYPKYGPGMMWERAEELVTKRGIEVIKEARVTELIAEGSSVVKVKYLQNGVTKEIEASYIISSMPLGQLVLAIKPDVPNSVEKAACGLKYRDHMTIGLIIDKEKSFEDNWLYIHYPGVKVGRIQNFASWSEYMAPEGKTCLGLEYFVFESDEFWNMDDNSLIEIAKNEIDQIGLVKKSDIEGGFVIRMKKAYPMYDENYRNNVEIIRDYLNEHAKNVIPVGRNGMHRYNNQDHSMYTAMLAVENILGADHDIWAVNVDEEYHEELKAAPSRTGRDAPILPSSRL
jgi:protoporphyrinogen oxidase